MTFLLFVAWIAVLVLLAGELDNLVSHKLFARFKLTIPEVSWWIPPATTAGLPGFGQFLNGQPIKALFIFLWPFATAIGAPILKPWQLILVKTGFFLFPWWIVAIADALVVSILLGRRRQQVYRKAVADSDIESRSVDMADYLERRQRKDPGSF